MQPIVSQSWPHPKLDAAIKPQPTNEKCWMQADRRIKSDQPIRESRVFRAQTARQLAHHQERAAGAVETAQQVGDPLRLSVCVGGAVTGKEARKAERVVPS